MIKLQDYTPEVYYNKSRDFQFIGRLYDLVLNSVKTNADLINNVPISQNSDSKLVDLVAMTLGFKSKHNYNIKQLTALCSIFSEVLKSKGSVGAVHKICNALISAEGLTTGATHVVDNETNNITLALPSSLSDTTLIRDLLNYVLPAGMTCNLISEVKTINSGTIVDFTHTVTVKPIHAYETSTVIYSIPDTTDSTEKLKGTINNITVVNNVVTDQNSSSTGGNQS